MAEVGEVLGLEHIDLSVSSLSRSVPFYDLVLGALGFSRVGHESYVAWSNGIITVGLREAAAELGQDAFDRYRPGLHHLAFKAKDRESIDRFHEFLESHELPVLDPPAWYPEYGDPYYAIFFADPDGMKLELVHFPWGYWRRVQSEGSDSRPRYRSPEEETR